MDSFIISILSVPFFFTLGICTRIYINRKKDKLYEFRKELELDQEIQIQPSELDIDNN